MELNITLPRKTKTNNIRYVREDRVLITIGRKTKGIQEGEVFKIQHIYGGIALLVSETTGVHYRRPCIHLIPHQSTLQRLQKENESSPVRIKERVKRPKCSINDIIQFETIQGRLYMVTKINEYGKPTCLVNGNDNYKPRFALKSDGTTFTDLNAPCNTLPERWDKLSYKIVQ